MNFTRKLFYIVLCSLSLSIPSLVYADAPVVDPTTGDGSNNTDSADYAGSPNNNAPVADANTATVNNNTSAPDTNSSASSVSTANPSTATGNTYNTSSMSLDDRVAQLERQIANMNQLNLLNQLNQLQQQVQDLTGQLELATHNLQVLQQQQKIQYADVDQRLSNLETPSANKSLKKTAIPATGSLNPATPDSANTAITSTDSQGAANNQTSNSDTTDNANQTAATGNSANNTQQQASANATNTSDQVANSLQEQNAYQKAYNLIKNKDYAGASTAMSQFVKQYPDSSYALNAHYWLGEMYLLQNLPGQAATEFNTVINKYPQNPKTSDAMLKLGFAYADQEDWQKARKQLMQVQLRFSGTSAGQLATERLKEMKLQGH